jgi:biopolymer transport protein ExbB/TolQ
MEEAILEVAPKLQRRTHYLAVISNIAVLLGLLGTILGLIVAFSAISGAEPGEKAIQLARGISLAMSTTAFGLVVAIPCLLFHAILQSKANRLLDDIDEYSVKAAHLLASQPGVGKVAS